ncbi:hypothetical protein Lepto7376_4530 [[Leptolyngbya] sp. PCC 7376]|uniref:hypothetical protein n=1 Tax=[Leptolyngbya] sp. PCC 7376 TaxID=111781 RepID=UPI00029F2814|nr:hypothetical protein [[Leptolyngbya] sp. PCC 7376]AFY40628.1 hypothetical protein Lepto7376_4530 [[Leptolyngbya] sp. PCC 7376]
MPLPENYNSSTHFLSVASKVLNPLISSYFDPEDEIEESDISSPLGALKQACKLHEGDSLTLVIAKMIFYALFTGAITNDIGDRFYGYPKTAFKGVFSSLEIQLIFYFKETRFQAKQAGRSRNRLDMRLTVRLLYRNDELTEQLLEEIQDKITEKFPSEFEHFKGLNKWSYYDPKNSFSGTRVAALKEADAVYMYESLCDIAGVSYIPGKLAAITKKNYVTETIETLGEESTKTNQPRTGKVRLELVELVLPNNKDFNLIARRGKYYVYGETAT